jgi:nickel transport protein
MARRLAGALLLAGGIWALQAQAHDLKLFASRIGDRIEGRVYFVGGDPALVTVRIEPSTGAAPVSVTTGSDGRFSAIVEPADWYRLVANVGDGHATETSVGGAAPPPAAGGSGGAMPTVDAGELEAIVARQLEPLREQLAAAEERVRLRDILGGLGYVVGLAGLAAWISSRRAPR